MFLRKVWGAGSAQSGSGKANPPAAVRSERSELLDCIRAVAIILVVVFHVTTRFEIVDLDAVAYFFRRFGALGVDLFFPLSGFLITGFLLRRREAGAIKVFFLRRFFRIVPLYFTAVTIYYVIMVSLDKEESIIDNIWICYTFLSGWFIFLNGVEAVPYTITWSLSVEEFAYIMFGLVSIISRRSLILFLVFSTLAPIFIRLYLYMHAYDDVYFFPLARVDSIAIGGLVAYFRMRNTPLIGAVIGLIAVVYALRLTDNAVAAMLGSTLFGLSACFFIILFDTVMKNISNIITKIGANIGFYSYFTYLFHLFVIDGVILVLGALGFTIDELTPALWPLAIACLVVTHGLAMLSYRIFEGPLMRFGRSLEPVIAPRPKERRLSAAEPK